MPVEESSRQATFGGYGFKLVHKIPFLNVAWNLANSKPNVTFHLLFYKRPIKAQIKDLK